MKQFRKKMMLAIALTGMLPAGGLKAQDTLTVSLSKALEIAMSESPTIKVADMEIQRVNYSKKERRGGLFPNVSLAGAYQRTIKKQVMYMDGLNLSSMFPPVMGYALAQTIKNNPPTPEVLAAQAAYDAQKGQDGSITVGRDNTFTGGLSATLPIIAPALWQTLKLSELELELAQEKARSSKIALVNQVTKAYYGILLAQDSYRVIKRSYSNTVENARVIANKYKQGTVSEYEWIRADVQVRNAASNLTSAESGVNLSKLQLKMLMGVGMDTELAVEGKLSDFEATMYGDVMAIDTTTLYKCPDMKQFEIQNNQLAQSLKINKATMMPVLAASFNYQYMSMVNDSSTFTSSHNWFPTSNLGLSLSIPIFQGGAKYYKSKQIKVQMDQMNYQRDNLKRGLELQAVACMDNIKKSLKKIESNKEGLKQAEKALAISQKMYDVGMTTYLDLTNAELAYISAGLSYNQAIYDYLSAKSDLEKLLGAEKN